MADTYVEGQVLRLNKLAMDALQQDQVADSLTYLKHAEELLASGGRADLLAITYNNFGCHYKRRKQYKVALEYLTRAALLEQQTETEPKSRASTQLNIAALHSVMKKHSHAQQALHFLDEATPDSQVATGKAVAHFNAAAECEHLQRWPEALKIYRNGWTEALEDLGPHHALTLKLLDGLRAAKLKAKHWSLVWERRHLRRVRVSPHRVPRRFIDASPELPSLSHRLSRSRRPAKSVDLKAYKLGKLC